jgi:CheY-like chemotaxis protein
MTTLDTPTFSFRAQELPDRLAQTLQIARTGYWQLRLSQNQKQGGPEPSLWYLAFAQGRIIYSGSHKLGWISFLQLLQRHVLRLRQPQARQTLLTLEQEYSPEQRNHLGSMLGKMQKLGLLSHDEAVRALRLQILLDFDAYLFGRVGTAEFVQDDQLLVNAPVLGFDLVDLMKEARQRRLLWQQLQLQVPSLEVVPILQTEAIAQSGLSADQQAQLQRLTQGEKNLRGIAESVARDPLELAQTFAKLIAKGLVRLHVPNSGGQAGAPEIPKVFVVDDSPLLLQQFRTLVSQWGYRVEVCQSPLRALSSILAAQPSIVFLDVNMPGTSGFGLIKQIRRHPELAELPLVLLTAERSVSNQWRAQWSGAKFLAKPLKVDEVATFQKELRGLLQEIAPLPA